MGIGWSGRREPDDEHYWAGGIASSSLVLLVLVLLYYSTFACDSASELERWARLPFRGFPALTYFLFFGTCHFWEHDTCFFPSVGDLLWVFIFIFYKYVPGSTLFWSL